MSCPFDGCPSPGGEGFLCDDDNCRELEPIPRSPVATPRTSVDALEEIALIRVLSILRILAPADVRVFLERCEYAYHDQANRKDTDGRPH